jgi:putative RNA methyltransferase
LEKFDLNVSALYIAQVKQKCGLELEENYNKSKKDNLVVQECPKKIKMLLWMH